MVELNPIANKLNSERITGCEVKENSELHEIVQNIGSVSLKKPNRKNAKKKPK